METKVRIKIISLQLLSSTFLAVNSFAQKIPFVYGVENTGARFSKPVLPTIEQLPTIEPLTDPFTWSDGKGRSTKFKNWSQRHAEIGAEIQHYEIGKKPDRPDTITASYSGNTLNLHVTENGKTLTLASISLK